MKMEYILYLDESSKKIDEKNFFCVGGVIINRQEYENKAIPKMNEIKNKYWGNNEIVWHYSKMLRNDGEFRIFKDAQIRGNFWDDVRKYLYNIDYNAVGVYIDNTVFENFFGNKNLSYHLCVSEIINTYIYFLSERKSQGSIVFESRNGTDNKCVWDIYNKILNNGTTLFEKKTVNKHLTTIGFINKKENNCGLQIADIIPYKLLETLTPDQKDRYNLRRTILAKLYLAKNSSNYLGFRKIF
jgi:hypothetical protein